VGEGEEGKTDVGEVSSPWLPDLFYYDPIRKLLRLSPHLSHFFIDILYIFFSRGLVTRDQGVLEGVKNIYKVDELTDEVAFYFIYYLRQLISYDL